MEAANGQLALEAVRHQLPDLIITDLVMPVMNGVEMLQKLRSDSSLQYVPVIVSSASVAQIDQQRSFQAGGNDFLAKPVSINQLLALLAKHLQLTWNYDVTQPVPNTDRVQSASASSLIPPPRSDLQFLLELAQDGLLKKMTITAEHIGQKNDRYQPFVQHLIQLAKKFQSDKIEILLQQYLVSLDNH
jgi:CheY-like chemotaxis protein